MYIHTYIYMYIYIGIYMCPRFPFCRPVTPAPVAAAQQPQHIDR